MPNEPDPTSRIARSVSSYGVGDGRGPGDDGAVTITGDGGAVAGGGVGVGTVGAKIVIVGGPGWGVADGRGEVAGGFGGGAPLPPVTGCAGTLPTGDAAPAGWVGCDFAVRTGLRVAGTAVGAAPCAPVAPDAGG
jgi:hypothetical protein